MKTLAIVGAHGRLGRAVAEAATAAGWRVAARVGRGDPMPSTPCSAVIDASNRSAVAVTAAWCADRRVPLVAAVSALGAGEVAALSRLAQVVPVVRATNLSAGHELQRRALAALAGALGETWEATVVERHPRTKRDAPSATARALSAGCADAGAGAPPIESLRFGPAVSDHELRLFRAGEELVLRHSVRDLRAMAEPAVRAAEWTLSAPAGLWSMTDVWHASVPCPAPPRSKELQR